MLTEAPRKKNRALFIQSDETKTIEVPQDARLPEVAVRINSAMMGGSMPAVHHACAEFLATASAFYKVPKCDIRVLAHAETSPQPG